MKIRNTILTFISLSCLAISVHAADKAHLLLPAEITSTFATGVPFAATAPSGKMIMLTLKPDGTAQATPKGKKKGKRGKWRLSDDGYCTTWEKSSEHCYKIRQNGAGYDVLNISGIIVAHWAK